MTKLTEPVALNVWAYFRQLSGKEIFAAAYRYDEEVLFTINYRADLTTACYVEYNGVIYEFLTDDGGTALYWQDAAESVEPLRSPGSVDDLWAVIDG